MAHDWSDDTRRERRSTVLRLLVATVVLGGGYAGLCVWSSQHVPASVSVGGIRVGGMTSESARAAIDKASRSLLDTPIALTVAGRAEPLQVVPRDAGLTVDAERSLEGLTGFTLDPRVVWGKAHGVRAGAAPDERGRRGAHRLPRPARARAGRRARGGPGDLPRRLRRGRHAGAGERTRRGCDEGSRCAGPFPTRPGPRPRCARCPPP